MLSNVRLLEELASGIDYGVTASADEEEVGPKFLRITDIQEGSVDWSAVPFCGTGPDDEQRAQLAPGDIVFARTGVTTGKSYLLRSCPERAVFASYLIRVRPNQRVVEPRYLAWYFHSSDYWRQIISSASGTAQPGVNATKLKSLMVPMRPLHEQRRIADILDKADAVRRKRAEAVALVDDLLRATFLDMFGDPVTNPEGWPVSSLGELAEEMRYGTSEKCFENTEEGALPVLRIPNVAGGTVDFTELKFLVPDPSDRARLLVSKGDLLFVRSNGNPEYIGRCAVFDAERDALFASYLIRVRLASRALARPDFVQAALSTPSYRTVLTGEARTTAGNYNISTEGLRRLRIVTPPLPLQERFSESCRAIKRLAARLRSAEREANHLFDALVQRAFTGELTAKPAGRTPVQTSLFADGA